MEAWRSDHFDGWWSAAKAAETRALDERGLLMEEQLVRPSHLGSQRKMNRFLERQLKEAEAEKEHLEAFASLTVRAPMIDQDQPDASISLLIMQSSDQPGAPAIISKSLRVTQNATAIANNPAFVGANVNAQCFWLWPPGSCNPLPAGVGLSSSTALTIMFLP
jgi:hypothetical protein